MYLIEYGKFGFSDSFPKIINPSFKYYKQWYVVSRIVESLIAASLRQAEFRF